MLHGGRHRIDVLLGRRTAFAPPSPPTRAEGEDLRAMLKAWTAGAPERFARTFLAGKPIFVTRPERELFTRLRACGLVEALAPSIYQPCARLFPLYERFIATDLLTHKGADQVFSLMFEQVYLVRNMGVEPGDRLLELCLGSGVNSLFAADVATSVTGIDVSERALAFARFNEALSPPPITLETRHGSLYEPLSAQRTFDLILVNPPFELVPHEAAWYLHSDGGEDGLGVVRTLLKPLPQRLAPGGRFEIITWSPGTAHGPVLLDLLREALPGMRLLVHELDQQPIDPLLATFRDSPDFEAYRKRLAARHLDRVFFLFVHAAPSDAPGIEVVTPSKEIDLCRTIAAPWGTA